MGGGMDPKHGGNKPVIFFVFFSYLLYFVQPKTLSFSQETPLYLMKFSFMKVSSEY